MDEQEILAVLREHVARAQSGSAHSRQRDDAAPVDVAKLDHISAELRRLRNGVGQLNARSAGLLNRAAQALKKFVRRSLSWYTRSLHEYHDTVNHALDYHGRALASLQHQISLLGGGLPEVLQETLRTARHATQEQLAPYAQLFRDCSPVLDLGCGEGEFLELLQQQGVAAHGVDSDQRAYEEAQAKSLQVVEADVFEHLAQLPDRSLGGVFSARLIEYLPSHRQADLISLCAGKLRPGGLLVLETANPGSDFPFGRSAHVDPSHLRAIYPEVLRAMVESNGFRQCNICVLAPQPVCVAESSNGDQRKPDSGVVPASPPLSRAPAYAAIARRP